MTLIKTPAVMVLLLLRNFNMWACNPESIDERIICGDDAKTGRETLKICRLTYMSYVLSTFIFGLSTPGR
jgi:hypothetical protein